jgi:hypothetical protein
VEEEVMAEVLVELETVDSVVAGAAKEEVEARAAKAAVPSAEAVWKAEAKAAASVGAAPGEEEEDTKARRTRQ